MDGRASAGSLYTVDDQTSRVGQPTARGRIDWVSKVSSMCIGVYVLRSISPLQGCGGLGDAGKDLCVFVPRLNTVICSFHSEDVLGVFCVDIDQSYDIESRTKFSKSLFQSAVGFTWISPTAPNVETVIVSMSTP